MSSLRLALVRIVLSAVFTAAAAGGLEAAEGAAPPAAPPFPSARAADWIGTPASWASLRGQVVLLLAEPAAACDAAPAETRP